MRSRALKFALMATASLAATAGADTGKVALPENYSSTFVRYMSVDKPNAESPEKTKMRFFYVSPEILRAAQAGEPAPAGTLLIMEDRAVKRDEAGKVILDSAGRFIPSDDIKNVFVQQKQPGWGADRTNDMRNGEWEYAWFNGDGTRKTQVTMDGCFACHKEQASANDYMFTFPAFLASMKR